MFERLVVIDFLFIDVVCTDEMLLLRISRDLASMGESKYKICFLSDDPILVVSLRGSRDFSRIHNMFGFHISLHELSVTLAHRCSSIL